jgi:hypothetical protein
VDSVRLEPARVLTQATEVLRELGWQHVLAKRGYARETRRYEQSLLDHSLVALDLLLALGEILARSDSMSPDAR